MTPPEAPPAETARVQTPPAQPRTARRRAAPQAQVTARISRTPAQRAVRLIPKNTAGTTVRYATWKNPYQNEDGKVVEKFQKKYGIKVKIDTIPQSTYVQEVTGKIAAGNSPDIFFDNGTFPASIACLQPLEAMQLDLNDGIWDQGMIKMSTLGGKPFLVNTVGNIWAEVDCLFYNKKIFADNRITTPEEYYKAGKWTFATLHKVYDRC